VNAIVSNVLFINVKTRKISRREVNKNNKIGLDWEPWFTTMNMQYQTAEAIPVLGRYDSFNLDVIRQHALWFVEMGIDFLAVDWTNNLWGKTSWEQRDPNVQQLCNATTLAIQSYQSYLNEGLTVPQFVLLLGLNNGPSTTLEAITEEMNWVYENYVVPYPNLMLQYLGKPLIVVFDGSGANHSDFTHPNFTIRWMASQLQGTGFDKTGYWSWMDGSITPAITYYNTLPEASTVTPAFFAEGGWLQSPGHEGGDTLASEMLYVEYYKPQFLFVCQWNEYAGQLNGDGYGPNKDIYVDSYSADFSNDIEPTSLQACAYPRPNTTCGGWGYQATNLQRALIDHYFGISQALDSTLLIITNPVFGQVIQDPLNVTWKTVGVSPSSNTIMPYLDSKLVTPLSTGSRWFTIDISTLSSKAGHDLTIILTGSSTYYPLSLYFYDHDIPLKQTTNAQASTFFFL